MHDGSQRILHAGEKVILPRALLWRRTHEMEATNSVSYNSLMHTKGLCSASIYNRK